MKDHEGIEFNSFYHTFCSKVINYVALFKSQKYVESTEWDFRGKIRPINLMDRDARIGFYYPAFTTPFSTIEQRAGGPLQHLAAPTILLVPGHYLFVRGARGSCGFGFCGVFTTF